MADMEKLQMMDLYAKLGTQMDISSKSVRTSKDAEKFQKLLKDKAPKPSKEPAGKVEEDMQNKETEPVGDGEEVLTEETKSSEQMAELLVMMNAVQETVVPQSESGIAAETVEPRTEELFFVQGTAEDGISDVISQTQSFQAESVIETGQKPQKETVLQEEQASQEGWAELRKSDAGEPVETQHIQNEAEQKTSGAEVQAGRQKEVQPEHTGQQEHITSANVQIQDHFTAPKENGNAEAKLVTTESTLPEDLAKTLAEKLPGKNGVLTLELEPESLGKLTIRMVYEEGKTVVSLMASSARALELLSQRSAEIASILEERTGERTEILTYEPQKNDSYTDDQKERGQRKEEGQRQNKKQENSASFLHQLRLGLI